MTKIMKCRIYISNSFLNTAMSRKYGINILNEHAIRITTSQSQLKLNWTFHFPKQFYHSSRFLFNNEMNNLNKDLNKDLNRKIDTPSETPIQTKHNIDTKNNTFVNDSTNANINTNANDDAKNSFVNDVPPQKKSTKNTKKAYKKIAITSFLFSCVLCYFLYKEYSQNPQGSKLDNLIIYFLNGKPYRDYLMLSGYSTIEGGQYSIITKDPSFSIKIPRQIFIRPGIILSDSIPNPNSGILEISDVFGNYLSWTWSRLGLSDFQKSTHQSNGEDYVIQSKSQDLLNDFNDKGYFIMHEEILHSEGDHFTSSLPSLNSISRQHFHPNFPSNVHISIMVKDSGENDIGYFTDYPYLIPSSEFWQGCAFFIHDGFLFVTSISYPNNLINFSILKDHIQDLQSKQNDHIIVETFEKQINRYVEQIGEVNSRNKMISQINESTYEHEEIIQRIRVSLLERLTEFIPEEPPKDSPQKLPIEQTIKE